MPSGGEVIVTVKSFESDVLLASVAVTVKVYRPIVVGVPVSTPLLRKLNPSGTEPLAIEKVTGETPPIVPTEPEYPTPTTPSGSVANGEMRTDGDTMESVSVAVARLVWLSTTTNTTGKLPELLVVPVMAPVCGLMLSPPSSP